MNEPRENMRQALLQTEYWWKQMHMSADELKGIKAPTRFRAELRRCTSADAAMLTEGFRALWLALPEAVRQQRTYSIEAWATISAILSHITEVQNCSFGASMGQWDSKSDKSVVSELRLQQLQGARTTQDFFRRLHRLVKQLGGKANPKIVAQDILDWFDEHYSPQPRRADKRVAVRWALDYFSQQPKKA
jgi:CRISPR system Cascade subunit CasB